MLSAPLRARGENIASRATHAPGLLWAAYGLMGILSVGYFASLVLRPHGQAWPLLDGWLVAGFEILASVMCLARAIGRRRGRAIALVLGGGLLSWAVGDLLLTIESVGGSAPLTPSLADAFYLGFYPLAYVALVLMMRRQIRELMPATWLDGAVAGLGAAAVCASFAFPIILTAVGGDPATVVTNLAYPMGDLLLLGLVVGGTAILPGRPRAPWLLLATGISLNAVGDTFNLFHSSVGGSHVGTVFDGIAWPVSILLMSLSVWLPPGQTDVLAPQKRPGFLLPGLGASFGLAILLVGTQRRMPQVALGLATVTLITVGIRLAFSVRGLRALTEKRQRQAITDELTGLGNRRHLFAVLDMFFADHNDPRTPPRQMAFLFVDLDHFKEINDSFGHSAGDQLLRQLGPRLMGSLRSSDVLVRIGGDELGVILLDANADYAGTVAQRFAARVEEPFLLDAVSVRISASIGIAVAPSDATDGAGLVRCADLAMYRAKLGGSRCEVYAQEIDDDGNRLRLVEELRVAVERGDFMLHYQPQVDLRTGNISAVEALLRWPHPRLGLVPPLEFLPLAEEAGLMKSLTAWVLEQALVQCAAWRLGGRELTVSVNVSTTDLLDPGFVGVVRRLLERHSLPASALIIEITETTIIGDFEACKMVIAELRVLGLGVSIDDFGAGFTSLAHLASLAVSELKLDRTFITGLVPGEPGRDLALVRGTIDLSHALGLRVVAEGVEDSATFELLAGAGCDLAQGYFIGMPVPAKQLALQPDLGTGAQSRVHHPAAGGVWPSQHARPTPARARSSGPRRIA